MGICFYIRRREDWISANIFHISGFQFHFRSVCSVIPAFWIMELKMNRKEMLCIYMETFSFNQTFPDEKWEQHDRMRSNMLLDVMQVRVFFRDFGKEIIFLLILVSLFD